MLLSHTSDQETTSQVKLPPSLDAHVAEELLRALREQMVSGLPVVIASSDVERVSTPCLQLLAAAAREARARGIQFRLEAPSETLTDALITLGLQAELAFAGAA